MVFVRSQVIGLVRGMFSGAAPTREIGGPIAIGMAAGQSVRRGPEDFFAFMALLSVNLAILNLLPIPILDGGQFLFLLVRRGHPPPGHRPNPGVAPHGGIRGDRDADGAGVLQRHPPDSREPPHFRLTPGGGGGTVTDAAALPTGPVAA